MFRFRIVSAIVVLLFLSCGKEQPEGPYVPWFPPEEDEYIDLDKAEKVILITEQAKSRIMLIDQPTGKIAWEWTPSDSGLKSEDAELFNLPSEAKPVLNRKCILITASAGGVGLVRVADKKLLFYAAPGGNPHSAELLPDGNIVVASSTGNKLTLYEFDENNAFVEKPSAKVTVTSGHNVVWDASSDLLWSAAGSQVIQFRYENKNGVLNLVQTGSYDMPSGNTEAHDLYPVNGEYAMYVSSNQHVYKFDCMTKRFLDVEIFQQKGIKSISSGPEGYPTIVTRPTSSSWWTAEVVDLKGNVLFMKTGYQIYKARWYVDNELKK